MKKQIFVGHKEPKFELMTPVKNVMGIPKPLGGLWTSSKDKDEISDWISWCRGESFRTGEWNVYELTPQDSANVYRINSYKDLLLLSEEFPMDIPSGLPSWLSPVDFESASKKYDGIRLTKAGQWRTRWTQPSFYGWDCESTLWFNWQFKKVKLIGKILIEERRF